LLTARFIDVPEAGGDALVFLQDVGEQREIAQRQKLAALGRLTGGIAHEIRNPLSAIRYASELLKEDHRSSTERRMIDIVLDNTHRLERIVHDVLELGRRDRATPQVVPLALFLSGFATEFVAASAWPAGRLEVDPAAAGTVSFDPSHLRQVLWNLAGNAGRYASNSPGAVRISARTDPFELAVEDDGPGVSADSAQKLFEPFFTTDPQGNGLGLYIARELCEANGCRLHYEPGGRGGARFVMTGGEA
jgi:two-component system sensor histidine kinase PilS (NtrC family)